MTVFSKNFGKIIKQQIWYQQTCFCTLQNPNFHSVRIRNVCTEEYMHCRTAEYVFWVMFTYLVHDVEMQGFSVH